MTSQPVLPSPSLWRVGIRIKTFEACSGFTHVAARRIAQLPKATFVTRLRSSQSPGQTARQLPDPSTLIRAESSSTRETRLQGAHRELFRACSEREQIHPSGRERLAPHRARNRLRLFVHKLDEGRILRKLRRSDASGGTSARVARPSCEAARVPRALGSAGNAPLRLEKASHNHATRLLLRRRSDCGSRGSRGRRSVRSGRLEQAKSRPDLMAAAAS